VSADLQLYRTAILAAIDWPDGNRCFQSNLAGLLHHLTLPADYCHEFVGDALGFGGDPDAIEKRVSRALREADDAARHRNVKLVEYQKGGGQKKRPTRYIRSYLNDAASALRDAVNADTEALPMAVKKDKHLAAAVALLPPRIQPAAKEPRPPQRRRLFKTPPEQDDGFGLSPYGIAAEEYARQGFKVVPLYSAPHGICDCKNGDNCEKAGKHPRLKKYIQCATRNVQTVRSYWRQWPNAGIGLLTGVEIQPGIYFVDIDIDRRNFGHGVWRDIREQDLKIEELDTQTVITKDGWQHHLFIRADRAPRSFSIKKSVDLKGSGNLVVVPPTIRANHGYTFRDDTPIAEATGPLREWILNAGFKQRELIKEHRHDWLVKCARRMAADDLIESDILGALRVRRDTCCDRFGISGREIGDEELAGIAKWARNTPQLERDRRKALQIA
jgi:hypothetical protein